MHASLTEQSVKILQLVGRRQGMRISDIILLTGVNLIELLKTLAQLEEGGAVTVALDSLPCAKPIALLPVVLSKIQRVL